MNKVLATVFVFLFSFFFVMPVVVFAQAQSLPNPYHQLTGVENLSIFWADNYGNSKEMSLKNLNCRKLQEISQNEKGYYQHYKTDYKLETLNNLFERQCLGKTFQDKQIYDAPYGSTVRTSINLFCQTIQTEQITKLYTGTSFSDLDQDMLAVYTNECVIPGKGLKLSDEINTKDLVYKENPVIKLAAPLPIEGGDFVENTNKTYVYSYMIKIYRFVIGIAGIVAVGEFVLGGYMIALAAGDSSRVESAKKRMVQTLEGLALLFVTAIILNTINPQAFNFDADVYVSEEMMIDVEAINRTIDETALLAADPTGAVGTNGNLDISTLVPIADGAYKKYYPAGKFLLRADAAEKWLEFMDFVKASGKTITVTSAYRSYQHQEEESKKQGKYAAPPRKSSHGWGIAVDIKELFAKGDTEKKKRENIVKMFNSETYKWITENAANFDWHNPNRLKDDYNDPNYVNNTTRVDEPWHFEFCPGQGYCP